MFGQRVLKGLQYASMIMIIIIDTYSIMINHIHHIKILDFDRLCKFKYNTLHNKRIDFLGQGKRQSLRVDISTQ